MQTGYLGIQALESNLDYTGGVCRFWYIPKEKIQTFPSIDPVTQYLADEPTLIDDEYWIGPVKVPNTQLGFTEVFKRNAAGIYHEQRIEGFHAGDSAANRVNYENLPYYQFVVVAKLRAGNQYIILGNDKCGLDFIPGYNNGPSPENPAGNKFTFYGESFHKAFILPAFEGEDILPPTEDTMNQTEIIYFTTETELDINWTPTRAGRFGSFPQIQTWVYNGDGDPELFSMAIKADAPPPSQTAFTTFPPGIPGFIVLK